MHQTKAADVIAELHGSGPAKDHVHELRVHAIWPGKTAYAIDRLCRTDFPALKKAGATTLGVLDVQSGPAIPALAHFLTWPSYEAREEGLAIYEADPEVAALNRSEADEFKSHVIGRHDTWLLRPTDFCPPLLGFTERPWYR